MENNGRKVPVWAIVAIISVFVTAIGWLFVSMARTQANADRVAIELNEYKQEVNLFNSQVLMKLSTLEANVLWIIKTLEKIDTK